MDSVAFRGVAGRFATGVTVVTTAVDGDHHAMTANSFTSVSLDPPLVLISVDRGSFFHDVVIRAGVFGVSVLAADQHDVAVWFATRGRPHDSSQFAAFPHRVADRTGVVLLDRALATIECTTAAVHPAGDHSLVLGAVETIDLSRPDDAALVFFAGSYRALGAVTADPPGGG